MNDFEKITVTIDRDGIPLNQFYISNQIFQPMKEQYAESALDEVLKISKTELEKLLEKAISK